MALREATVPLMSAPALPDGPPYDCRALGPWVDLDFDLPPGDPRLRHVDRGGAATTPAMANLVGAVNAWEDWPRHMDFLDEASPMHAGKLLERSLYLHHWRPFLVAAGRILDLGGGIGRFTMPCLDARKDVELVDPDLRALRRAVSHAAGRPGRLDVHWTTGEALPDLPLVDAVIAAEVLNYVDDAEAIVAAIDRVLKPDGTLLLSVEARWGWPFATDVPAGTLETALEGGTLHVDADRHVRTFDAEDVRDLLDGWEVLSLVPSHYIFGGPFERAARHEDIAEILHLEDRLRAHPVYAPLNRAWTAVARR